MVSERWEGFNTLYCGAFGGVFHLSGCGWWSDLEATTCSDWGTCPGKMCDVSYGR